MSIKKIISFLCVFILVLVLVLVSKLSNNGGAKEFKNFNETKSLSNEEKEENHVTFAGLEESLAGLEVIKDNKNKSKSEEIIGLNQDSEEVDQESKFLDFLDVTSKEHKEILQEYNQTSTLVVRGNVAYIPYKTELGVEFFKAKLEHLKNHKQNFYEVNEEFRNEFENNRSDWSPENETKVRKLVEDFNEAELYISTLQCKEKVCIAQLIVQNSSILTISKFSDYIISKRAHCSCKAFGYISDGESEGIIKFVFD